MASIDESEPYEVDETGIYINADGKFIVLTASGCSCWDGDYEEKQFDSLEEVEKALIGSGGSDEYRYNPSFSGIKTLMLEARANFKG